MGFWAKSAWLPDGWTIRDAGHGALPKNDANLQQAASNRRPNRGKIKLDVVAKSKFGSVLDSQGGVSLDWRWGSH